MAKLYPLKTLILYKDKDEIASIEQYIRKHSGIFHIHRIATDTFDLLHVINSDNFDVTFFDDAFFPISHIENFGKHRFGIIVFKNKETLAWKDNLLVKNPGYYSFAPPFTDDSLVTAISNELKNAHNNTANNKEFKFYKFTFQQASIYIPEYDIICIKVKEKFSRIYCIYNNNVIEVQEWQSLNEFQQQIHSQHFFRTNRNALVNLNFVQHHDKTTNKITLSKYYKHTQIEVFLSKSKRRTFKEAMKKRMGQYD